MRKILFRIQDWLKNTARIGRPVQSNGFLDELEELFNSPSRSSYGGRTIQAEAQWHREQMSKRRERIHNISGDAA